MTDFVSAHTGDAIDLGISEGLLTPIVAFVSATERDTYFTERPHKLFTDLPIMVLVDPVTVEIQVWRGVDAPETYANTDWGASTFRAGLNSLGLGGQHLIHSAGENILFQNLSSDIQWYPVWTGLRPYGFTGGEWLSIAPSSRIMTTVVEDLQINGPAGNNNVNYADTIVLQNNESVWGVEVRAGETFEGEIVYTLNSNDNPEITKFSQRMQVNVVENELIHIHFRHPSESLAGSTINVDIRKRDGTPFFVKAGADGINPWINLHLGQFRDVDVALDHKEFVTSLNGTADWGSHYLVSLDNAGLDTLTAPIAVATHARQAFRVQDGNSGFSNSNGVIVTFINLDTSVVTATLNKKDDNCEFIFDGAVWRYINDRTGKAGVV